MNFREYVSVLRERWLLVLLGLVMGLGGGGAVAFLSTPQYASSATYFISTPTIAEQDVQQAYQGSLLSAQKIKSYTELATGRRIREQVSLRIEGPDVAPGVIKASAQPDTVLLTITARDASPERAHDIVRHAGRAFTELVADIEKPSGLGSAPVIAREVQGPQVSASPVSPRPVLDLSLGGLLGLLAGIGMAVARHTLDRTVKSAEMLAGLANAPVLGSTSYDPRVRSRPLIVHDQPRAPLAEAFRRLRTNLQYVDLDNSRKLIVVTSSMSSEGKTTTACNLAIVLSQAGRKVMLVEADLRRPKAAEYLGLENAIGVTSVLTGKVTLDQAIQPWGGGMLDFLGAGALPPNPSELLASHQMALLLEDLRDRYEVVLIDTAPTLPVTDAAVLAAQCDGALLVVRHGKITTDQARAAAESLHRVSATLLGAIVTMTPRSKRHAGYSYSYQYGNGVPSHEVAAPVSPAGARHAGRSEAPSPAAPTAGRHAKRTEPRAMPETRLQLHPHRSTVGAEHPVGEAGEIRPNGHGPNHVNVIR